MDDAARDIIAALLYPAKSRPLDKIMPAIGRYLLSTGLSVKHATNACAVMISAISVFVSKQSILTKCNCDVNSAENPHVCYKSWTRPWFNKKYEELCSQSQDITRWDRSVVGKEQILKIIAKFGEDFGMYKMQIFHENRQYCGRVVINKRWRCEHLLANYAAWTQCAIRLGVPRDIRWLILQVLVAME